MTALKKVKLFIACLSDEYASNDRCRMEFQYAKKTLKIPVIPVVVGLLLMVGYIVIVFGRAKGEVLISCHTQKFSNKFW